MQVNQSKYLKYFAALCVITFLYFANIPAMAYENAKDNSIQISVVGSYQSGIFNGSGAEISANKDQLVAILTYHVVAGKVMSGDIADKKLDLETLQGTAVAVDAMSGVKIDDAMVTSADIETSNSVIHVIDKVIIPN